MSGSRTIISMTVALAVALYQQFVGPIEAVDQEVWAVAVPAAAIVLRLVTREPVSFRRWLELAYRVMRYKKPRGAK